MNFIPSLYDILKEKEKNEGLTKNEKQLLDDLEKKYKDDDRKISAC